jgi:hypothetical protein
LNIPKLQAVGSELNRVENPQPQTSSLSKATSVSTTNLERTIAVNQIIVNAIDSYTIDYWKFDEEIRFMLQQKIKELKETIGEQKLSLQLLKLLLETNGDKEVAANTIDKMMQRYLHDRTK